ncbi:MAG TPA: class I SAM-dependent methyltransferase [Blastocatellia bacterium]|nr:class I SAM-dependent methyltransferase [Blastocatellia bacterium]
MNADRGKLRQRLPQSPQAGGAKQAARKQWGENPCGAHVARDQEFGTREFFESIERYRYQVYAPWMKELIGFDDYPGKRLLEVGCGTGTDLLQFARGGALVTGFDLTPRSIEIARRRFEVYGLAGEFANGDAENLSFADETFDVVYSFGVIHHTPDTERAASEIYRVLRKGGQAIVMIYHRTSLYYWGGIMFKRGLLRGQLLRESPSALMSRYVEHTETGGRPLVKAYTRKEALRLFRDFRKCEAHVHQLTRPELGLAGRLLPEDAFQRLARSFGWNILIKATK